jgi:RimJ/RimL family protein N-acetyltransferase
MKILKDDLIIKKMDSSHIKKLYDILNLPYINKYYSNELDTQWDSHNKWYNFILNSPYYKMFILSNFNNDILGNIKFEIDDSKVILSIFIIPEIRNNKFSYFFIEESLKELKKEISIETIEAFILEENSTSISIFENLGFDFSNIENYNGIPHKLYVKHITK